MKTEVELNKMILSITNNIRKNHPELLEHLNEMPVTIPTKEDSTVTVKALSSYYNSLVELVKEYEENDTKNVKPGKF